MSDLLIGIGAILVGLYLRYTGLNYQELADAVPLLKHPEGKWVWWQYFLRRQLAVFYIILGALFLIRSML